MYGQTKTVQIKYEDYKLNHRRMYDCTIYYDVESLSPVFKIETDTFFVQSAKQNRYFYYKEGKPIEVCSPSGIKYKGGYKKLKDYFISEYWQKYNGTEINGEFMFIVLFDAALNIKDITIISISACNNSEFDFYKLIKDILYSTKGNWEKNEIYSDKDYYFFLGRLPIG